MCKRTKVATIITLLCLIFSGCTAHTINSNGNVLKIYDYSLKELPINLDGTVTYNGKRWTFDKKQNF